MEFLLIIDGNDIGAWYKYLALKKMQPLGVNVFSLRVISVAGRATYVARPAT